MVDKTSERIGPDHPISVMAGALSDNAFVLAAGMQMSRWDMCVAMANAIGHILADSGKPLPEDIARQVPAKQSRAMPRDAALGRMNDLIEVMQGAYDLRNIEGEA